MRCNALLLVYRGSNRGGASRGRQGREGRALGGSASGLEKFYYIFFLKKYCADVENCKSFRGFGSRAMRKIILHINDPLHPT